MLANLQVKDYDKLKVNQQEGFLINDMDIIFKFFLNLKYIDHG